MSFIPNPLVQHIFLLLGCQPPDPKPGLVHPPSCASNGGTWGRAALRLGSNLGVRGPDATSAEAPTGGCPWGVLSRQRQCNGGGPVPQSVGQLGFVPDHSSNPGFGNTKLTNRSKNEFNLFFRKVTLQPIGIFSLNLNLSTDFLARVIIGLWPEIVSSPKRTGIICFLSTTALLPIPVFNMHLLILGLCIMLIQVSLNKIS